MDNVPSDPVIGEVRAVRRRISARFDHDPARLVAYHMGLREERRDRLINAPEAEGHVGDRPGAPAQEGSEPGAR